MVVSLGGKKSDFKISFRKEKGGKNDNCAIFPQFTPAQITLARLMHKDDWIVPIPGTTKLAHLEENIRAAEINISKNDWKTLENELSKIEITGSRYPADQQAQVGK